MSEKRVSPVLRFSSRRQHLGISFLSERLKAATSYDRIAGYFSSSILEVAGEALEAVRGEIRMVCNSDLHPSDVKTARAAALAVRRSWCAGRPEQWLKGPVEEKARKRFKRLFQLLHSGKLKVRVLPDAVFGLIHGKAGVIAFEDGTRTCFMGSANESRSAWDMNYELIWEDPSAEAVSWVQEEFDALWGSSYAVALCNFVMDDLARLSERRVAPTIGDWRRSERESGRPEEGPAVIETPVYRREAGLWEHQKYFIQKVFEAHQGPEGKARFVLADQVGLGKTLQLAISALLIALTGERPILVICPKTLQWQWQGEMRDLLDMPSAVWDGRRWVDEAAIPYPVEGPEGIRKCPRRVGIVSAGLITRGSEAAALLLKLHYDCVILDEAHRARRRNLGENRDGQKPDPNNLLRFMYQMAECTRTLLLATATPVQLRPVEAWDLLDILSRGHESVLGNLYSPWRKPAEALPLVMGQQEVPEDLSLAWEWLRNPFPPKKENKDFEVLRRRLDLADNVAVATGRALTRLRPPDRDRLGRLVPRLFRDHNPFIRHIIRRTREQLEQQRDPETGEPFLRPVKVELLGESEEEAILLPAYLREAYELAEAFCRELGRRLQSAGFLKTLLLRRMGSSIHAGWRTAAKMLASWETMESEEEGEDDLPADETPPGGTDSGARTLTASERALLERYVAALEAYKGKDPKFETVQRLLMDKGWLREGCIVFSQYRDSILWLAEQLTQALPEETIAVYSGPDASGFMKGGQWRLRSREELKQRVAEGTIRLMLGTDAASEGLNLQRLSRLINLDLPWNPTRLEQRKGRIQRIGQVHDTVFIYNMRYKDSVEDRVHELLANRLHDIHNLFGQIPDVLEDVWVSVALGEREQAKKIIDVLPGSHPFEIRYAAVEKINWESCRDVLDQREKERLLRAKW